MTDPREEPGSADYQGGSPGYQTGPVGHQPAARQPRNGLGTAALVLGIVGIFFALIPVIGPFVALPLALLAIVFGVIGALRVGKGIATNRGMSISGLVLGIGAGVVAIAVTAAAVDAVDQAVTDPVARGSDGGNGGDSAGGTNAASGNASGASGSDSGGSGSGQQPRAGIGDTVTDGKLAFTVTGVNERQSIGDGVMATEAQGKYVVVRVRVRNTGNEPATFNAGPSQVAFDRQDRQYQTSEDAIMSGSAEDQNSFLQQINPGSAVQGRLIYDVPGKVKLVRLQLKGGTFTSGTQVRLQ